ncbi:MAG TPA: tRNA guanosine(34) transglycosylase Tgt, partial [Candidatus Baltobacteraceae bacterium]|nr:tRNA guanosine(34) transglycosylase Tgt [Candidatus Baltobacteraceae bacterium]
GRVCERSRGAARVNAGGPFRLVAGSERARRGSLALAHGVVDTPAFMPVGTAASVKGLTPQDLVDLGAQIVLANTYHLWLRPGLETIQAAGGLHAFMSWQRPILTDSGGFQVFSLESRRTLDDEGVRFRSHLDGSEHFFTPENVVAFQEALGVDVAMALDVCVKLPAEQAAIDEAVRLTSLWARRCAAARSKPETLLFGIVQGGLDRGARERSAADLTGLDLPGYAIGGLSVGESRDDLVSTARFTAALLPADRPRYLMGVGTVRDVVLAIDCGIDLFDCVYPTRCGRNGRALTRRGDLNIRNALYGRDQRPLDEACSCSVCRSFTRAYLSHLFRAQEMLGPRLLSYHNLAVLLDLVADARAAIEDGTWPAFRDLRLGELDASSPG